MGMFSGPRESTTPCDIYREAPLRIEGKRICKCGYEIGRHKTFESTEHCPKCHSRDIEKNGPRDPPWTQVVCWYCGWVGINGQLIRRQYDSKTGG